MNETPKKLVGAAYGRVSTDQLAQTEHGSLEQQRHLAKDWAEMLTRKTGIKHQIDYFLEDAAISGATENRPAYQKLLTLIRQRKISFVILKELSRAGRNLQSLLNLKTLTQENGVALHIRGLPDIDLSTATGEMMLSFIGALAQYERAQCIQRVKDNTRSAALNNSKINGGPVVLGFDRIEGKKGFWKVNTTEMKSVVTLMEIFLETGSLKFTALEARRLGIKPKKSKQFTPKSVRSLLANPKYVGRMEVVHGNSDEKRTWVDLPYGQPVAKELFDSVQARLVEMSGAEKNQNRFNRRVYLLAGLLRTPDGAKFTGQSCQGRSGKQFYYYWSARSKMRVYAEEVEAAVFDCLIKNLKDEKELAKNAITLAQKKNERGSYLENRRSELRAEFTKIEAEERDLLNSLRDKLTSNSNALAWLDEQIAKLTEQKSKIETELLKIEGEIQNLRHMRTDVASVANQFAKRLTEIKKGEAVRARAFLRQVIESATVLAEGKIILRWRIPDSFTEEEKVVSKVKWLRRRD